MNRDSPSPRLNVFISLISVSCKTTLFSLLKDTVFSSYFKWFSKDFSWPDPFQKLQMHFMICSSILHLFLAKDWPAKQSNRSHTWKTQTWCKDSILLPLELDARQSVKGKTCQRDTFVCRRWSCRNASSKKWQSSVFRQVITNQPDLIRHVPFNDNVNYATRLF